jgi:hypothetical protein
VREFWHQIAERPEAVGWLGIALGPLLSGMLDAGLRLSGSGLSPPYYVWALTVYGLAAALLLLARALPAVGPYLAGLAALPVLLFLGWTLLPMGDPTQIVPAGLLTYSAQARLRLHRNQRRGRPANGG